MELVSLITAIATSVAALAAVAAVIATWRATYKEHKNAVLWDRLHHASLLLTAFEELQGLNLLRWQGQDVPIDALEEMRSRARFLALLRASPEPFPITRGSAFRHIPFGADDPDEFAYLESAPTLGNPETDDEMDMKIRAEIVGVLDSLRAKLQGPGLSNRHWKGRSLSDGIPPID